MVRVKGFVGLAARGCGSATGAARVEVRRRRRARSLNIILLLFGAVKGSVVVEVNRESGFYVIEASVI
jgi:hypothetical protein